MINDLIKLSKPNKSKKIIFVWPEGIIPNTSQDDLKEYSWLFEKKFNKNHIFLIGINKKEEKKELQNIIIRFLYMIIR